MVVFQKGLEPPLMLKPPFKRNLFKLSYGRVYLPFSQLLPVRAGLVSCGMVRVLFSHVLPPCDINLCLVFSNIP